MPRDDVERARNVRNALANASVSERKRRGNGFPPPTPLASTPPSTLENRPVCASPIHSAPLASLLHPSFIRLSLLLSSLPFPRLFAQRLSLWSVSSHFLAIPSGNYYKSESQSIFNPRGMVFGRTAGGSWRTSGRCTFGGDRRGVAGADATMPVMR